jgi:ABC-type uncharacterized transport system involved in gliding motility auxiliary subunit
MRGKEPRAARRTSYGWMPAVAAGLILVAVVRGSINGSWDGWCTAGVSVGGALAVAWAAVERVPLRRRLRRRAARYGGQAIATSCLLLALLALANFVAQRHNRSFDLTESRLFTLSSQTQQVLRELPRDVHLLAFFPTGGRDQAAQLLRRYGESCRRLSYEFIDPDQEPERAQHYEVTAYGTVVLEPSGLDSRTRSGKPVRVEAEQPASSQRRKTYVLSEEKLTNALLKFVRGQTKTIYFLQGHGEADPDSPELNGYGRVRHVLEEQSFVVKPLSLAKEARLPADCALLVVAGPAQEPSPGESAAVQKYLEAGGKAMFLVDPAPGAGMEKFLGRWGLRVGRDFVVDASGGGRMYGAGPAIPLVKDYDGQHPITRNFRLNTLFPLARSLAPKENPGDAAVWPLAQTGPESFAEPYTGGPRHGRFDPAHDRKGPILLAEAVTRAAKEGREARLVVIGSSNFITNSFFDKAGNGDFFLNCINWLAQEEDLIAIRPRPQEDRRVELTEQQGRGIFWLSVLGMPIAALVLGLVAYWRRR